MPCCGYANQYLNPDLTSETPVFVIFRYLCGNFSIAAKIFHRKNTDNIIEVVVFSKERLDNFQKCGKL
jgi:hypothetical protein